MKIPIILTLAKGKIDEELANEIWNVFKKYSKVKKRSIKEAIPKESNKIK